MIDFLVIGGGIAGISAGARLSDHGRVLVLEAEQALCHHASGRSAALYEARYGRPATVALNLASRDWHQSADGGVLSPRGLLLVGGPDDGAAFVRDMTAMGLDPISPAEAMAMVPILDPARLRRAGFHADAFDIDTDRLVQGFARRIRANGGEIRTSSRVTAIRPVPGGWQLGGKGLEARARNIVNAAGAWADEIARMARVAPVGLVPMRRSMARIPAPGGHDVRAWPMIFGPGESWYARPDAGKLIVSPADEDPFLAHDAWADDMVIAEGLARFEAMMTTPVQRVETTWAGLRTFAPDRCLVLGPDPKVGNFIWSAGQGGYGFQTAPAASRLVADLVTGAAPELPAEIVAALRPDRLVR